MISVVMKKFKRKPQSQSHAGLGVEITKRSDSYLYPAKQAVKKGTALQKGQGENVKKSRW